MLPFHESSALLGKVPLRRIPLTLLEGRSVLKLAVGIGLLGLGQAAFALLWLLARLQGTISGPPSFQAEMFALAAPAILLLLSIGCFLSAPLDAATRRLPQLLPVRLRLSNPGLMGEWGRAVIVAFSVWTTMGFEGGFAARASVYPRAYADAWECVEGDDGTSCGLDDQTSQLTSVFHGVCFTAHILGLLSWLPSSVFAFAALRRLRRTSLPVLEISSARLVPGSTIDLLARQVGLTAWDELSVRLECVERATYSQGSSSTTKTEVIWSQTVASARSGQRSRTTATELQGRLAVPLGVMHSFKSSNNEVLYQLVVQSRGLAQHAQSASWTSEKMFPVTLAAFPEALG